MAVTMRAYAKGYDAVVRELVDYLGDTIKVLLVESSYSPSQAHDRLDDVDPATNEVTGTGYARVTLAGKTITFDGTDTIKLDADDAGFASMTLDSPGARYAVVYDDAGATDADKVLLAYVDFGADQLPAGETLTIQWSADGVLRAQAAAAA